MKKADYIHRAIAKIIDFLIVAFLAQGGGVGVVAGAVYIAISDGFPISSLGKKLIGLKVLVKEPDGLVRRCGFRESIIRNLVFGAVVILGSIPLIGWFIFLPLGVFLIAVESYFIYVDEAGIRIGDIFAGSQVVDVPSSN